MGLDTGRNYEYKDIATGRDFKRLRAQRQIRTDGIRSFQVRRLNQPKCNLPIDYGAVHDVP